MKEKSVSCLEHHWAWPDADPQIEGWMEQTHERLSSVNISALMKEINPWPFVFSSEKKYYLMLIVWSDLQFRSLSVSSASSSSWRLTGNIAGFDLDDVGGELHHQLLVHHSSHLTDHGPLGPTCPGQPLLIGEHRHLLCGQVTHDHLSEQSECNTCKCHVVVNVTQIPVIDFCWSMVTAKA